jgi:BCCT family betaine/carnitine transporter
MMWIFLGIMVVFLAAHMDAVKGALLKIMAIGTKVSMTHQNRRAFGDGSCPSLKLIVIILIQTYGLVKWLIQDYAKVPSHLIEQQGYDDAVVCSHVVITVPSSWFFCPV